MNARQKIDKVFRAAHLAAIKRPGPVFDADWQARVMDDVRHFAGLAARAPRNEGAALNAFALRLAWAMFGVAFVVSATFFMVGMSAMNKTTSVGESSLWELVDQNVNDYGISLLNPTDQGERSDAK